jgi:hypothetical protein
MTYAPLHDEIGLALAANDFMQFEGGSSEFTSLLRACIQPTLDRDRHLTPLLEILVAHHLLTRLANCLERPSRRTVADRVLARLESFTRDPLGWVGTFSWTA